MILRAIAVTTAFDGPLADVEGDFVHAASNKAIRTDATMMIVDFVEFFINGIF